MDPKAQKLISNYAKNFKDRYWKKKAAEAAKRGEKKPVRVDDVVSKYDDKVMKAKEERDAKKKE